MASKPLIGTNKERIELLEKGIGMIQDRLQHLEVGMANKLKHLETTINHLFDVLLAYQETPHINHHRDGYNGGRQIVLSKTMKLEFPHFAGDDTEWFNHVNYFFKF